MKVTIGDDGKIEIGDFLPAEAYGLAVRLESDGILFYEKASSFFFDERIRPVFEGLLESERRHLRFFRAKLEIELIESGGGSGDGLAAHVDPGVFGSDSIEARLETVGSAVDALRVGASLEMDTIRFYEALLEKTPSEEGKRALGRILEEEWAHLKALQEHLR